MGRKRTNRDGRPTLASPEKAEELARNIAAGVPVTHAALLAGIGRSTLMQWLQKGRAARERAEAGHPPELNDHLYVDFLDRTERARAQAAAAAVAVVQKVAHGGYVRSKRTYVDDQGRTITETTYADPEWKAAQFLLERQFREEFGKSTYVDLNVVGQLGLLGIPEQAQHGQGLGPAGGEKVVESLAAKLLAARQMSEEETRMSGEEPVDAEVIEEGETDG